MNDNNPARWALQFHGRGGEYFRIWIVNLLLSILTLGIYSAWAKVRRLKYFYGNTELAGSRFDYTAKPLQILIGRLIAFAFFFVYAISSNVSPILSAVAAVLLLAALPWMIVRSIRFNLRQTRYRNVAFDFHGSVWGAVKNYLLLPLLLIPTLGLALPFVQHQQYRFVLDHASFGQQRFSGTASAVGAYYRAALAGLGLMLALVALFALTVGVAMWGGGNVLDISALATPAPAEMAARFALPALAYIIMLIGFNSVGAAVQVAQANHGWSNTVLDDVRFSSSVNPWAYGRMMAWRLPLAVVTLGLALPWLKVAQARVRTEGMQIEAPHDLSQFAAAQQQSGSAIGAEASDLFDVDLAL
ncbi:YjgN family protein [Chitinibacter sp. GC72]|uniref:YjgN family protein n=1 Tax=Chitinibacter sp. GC72 TaxID=1526917 RepID=UPI0012FAEE5F|nr:YjgN family protein [Chitinibacter sp. GC72]